VQVAPDSILWPDSERQWEPVMAQLQIQEHAFGMLANEIMQKRRIFIATRSMNLWRRIEKDTVKRR
jgi:hypothetical protein